MAVQDGSDVWGGALVHRCCVLDLLFCSCDVCKNLQLVYLYSSAEKGGAVRGELHGSSMAFG